MTTAAQRVVARYVAATEPELLGQLKAAADAFKDAERFLTHFPQVLAKAERDDSTGLQEGEVWQDRFNAYWKGWEPIRTRLRDLAYEFEYEGEVFYQLTGHITEVTGSTHDPRAKARLEYAFAGPLWRLSPKLKRNHIAYKVERLKAWHEAATKWAKEGERLVKQTTTRAKRRRR